MSSSAGPPDFSLLSFILYVSSVFIVNLLFPWQNSSQELHQGVIASLVDNVGAAALVTLDGKVRLSVDLNVSNVSPAHIDVSFLS